MEYKWGLSTMKCIGNQGSHGNTTAQNSWLKQWIQLYRHSPIPKMPLSCSSKPNSRWYTYSQKLPTLRINTYAIWTRIPLWARVHVQLGSFREIFYDFVPKWRVQVTIPILECQLSYLVHILEVKWKVRLTGITIHHNTIQLIIHVIHTNQQTTNDHYHYQIKNIPHIKLKILTPN